MMQFKKRFSKKNAIIIRSWSLFLLIFLLAFVSCQEDDNNNSGFQNIYIDLQESKTITQTEIISEETKFKEEKSLIYPEIIDAADTIDDGLLEKEILKYKPNELGRVMILMYHKIGEPESVWMRSPENFRQD